MTIEEPQELIRLYKKWAVEVRMACDLNADIFDEDMSAQFFFNLKCNKWRYAHTMLNVIFDEISKKTTKKMQITESKKDN